MAKKRRKAPKKVARKAKSKPVAKKKAKTKKRKVVAAKPVAPQPPEAGTGMLAPIMAE